jgi:hypothetical protein
MERVYHPYWLWEDYKAGMYQLSVENEEDLVKKSINLLTDIKMFKTVSEKVINKWIVASKVNLTNPNCNQKAWIGQASCCFEYGVPEYLTRIAWGSMLDEQRLNADSIALDTIKLFLKQNERKNNQLHLLLEN